MPIWTIGIIEISIGSACRKELDFEAEKQPMRISFHRSRSICDRYDITDERDIKIAGQKLARYFEQKTEIGAENPRGVKPEEQSADHRSRAAAVVLRTESSLKVHLRKQRLPLARGNHRPESTCAHLGGSFPIKVKPEFCRSES